MADDKKNATLAQESDNAKAADNKDAEKLSEEELDAITGGSSSGFCYTKLEHKFN